MPPDPLIGDRSDWRAHIERNIAGNHVAPTRAHTFKHAYSTASKPAALKCDDGKDWVVKAQFARQGITADCVLAKIGQALGAPVPETGRVEVSPELIAAEPRLRNLPGGGAMEPGIWHGSRWIDGVHQTGDKRNNAVLPIPENAERYGRLAMYVAWCGGGDRQFVYEDDAPYLVHLVDMGHALPGANGWTARHLDAHVASAPLPADLWAASAFDRTKAESIMNALDPIACIAHAVSEPLDHWSDPILTMDTRIALAHYLSRQFTALQQSVAAL